MTKDSKIEILDVVALIQDFDELGLVAGQVGTIVEQLEQNVFEVEFCNDSGRTFAQAAFSSDSLLVLHYNPIAA